MKNKVILRFIIPPAIIISFIIVLIVGLSTKNSSDSEQSNWILQTNLQSQLRGRTVSDMVFTDSLVGFAVTPYVSGDSTFIFKTTNGGYNWFILVAQSSSLGGFSRIRFINQNTGFTCGNYLRKTTDSGNNWNIINTGAYYPENMFVLNKDTIYLTYHESMTGGIFRTTDGGGNWQQIYSAGLQNPQNIYMFNSRIGFYCSQYSKFYKTTDGGYNWTFIDNNGFYDIKFIDSLTGYRAFGDIQKTTNGGYNWNTQILPNVPGGTTAHWIQKFFFFGRDTIWAVGSHIQYHNPNRDRGIINKTTNGGLNWGYQLPDTHIVQIPGYNRLSFYGNKFGWSYNGLGVGVHTSTGGDSTIYMGINNNITSISGDYILYQNYPNPFNPVSSIKYQVLRSADIKLIVYNIIGREITTLVNKKQNSGEYSVKFDGDNLSSGVYFYSLFVDEIRIDTKKLILLK